MGKIMILKAGGSADLDVITAGAGDILTGKTGVNQEGEPLAGSMPNKGAVSQSLNAGGSYTIPAGYHNGAGKVTANSLSSQTSANATAAQILSGQTAWVNGAKVTGSMANRGAANQALAINGSYTIPAGYHNGGGKVTQSVPVQGGSTTTPGTANKTVVAANRYVNGNVIVAGNGNLTAGNIKKGVNIFGVTGTWEGWVATATDLYKNGVNSASFAAIGTHTIFESNSIICDSTRYSLYIRAAKTYNLSAYSKINIEYMVLGVEESYLKIKIMNGTSVIASTTISPQINVKKTVDINISAVQATFGPSLEISSISSSTGSGTVGGMRGYLYRVWLS